MHATNAQFILNIMSLKMKNKNLIEHEYNYGTQCTFNLYVEL